MQKFDANVLIKDSSRPSGATRAQAGEISLLFAAIYKKYHALAARRVAGIVLTERGAHFLRAVRVMQNRATVGELARRMHVTPSTISILAKRLERQGFLRRRRRPDGRRSTTLQLTPPTRRLLSKMRQAPDAEPLAAAVRSLSALECRSLLLGLRKLDAIAYAPHTRHGSK